MLVESAPEMAVIGESANGAEAVQLACEAQPDVVLMDVAMPQLDGVEATRRITAAHPAARIVMLTAHGHQSQVQAALQAGAAGYLLKDTPADEVVRAVQAAHAGVTLPGAAG